MEPLLLSTWSFGLRGHARAWPGLRGGGSALDAVEAVCRAAEEDPEVDSVGFGGLPDAEGRVTLDAAVMLSPDRCGGVAALSRHLHAASIARRVMERSPYLLLVGDGADRFADEEGFAATDELLSAEARAAWERWREAPHVVDQSRDSGLAPSPRPVDVGGGRLFEGGVRAGVEPPHDTIAVIARDARGALAGACSTSGTPFTRAGRVGDCPIIGHGLYVHPQRGAAVATGWGELVMAQCGAFLAVELMGSGRSPREAALEVLRRVAGDHALRAEHQVALIAVAPDGRWSSAALRDGYRTSVTTPDRNEVVAPDEVLLDAPADDPYGQAK